MDFPTAWGPPAIICDADKLSQVAIIQELGRLGIPVIALADSPAAMGFASKYTGRRVVCPLPSHDPEYVRFLVSAVPRGVIFYSSDANAENMSRHRQQLAANGFSVFIAEIGTLERIIQKDRLYETARQCGISVPRCAVVGSATELEQKVREFGLPLILKSTNLAGGIYRFVPGRDTARAVFREMSSIVESDDLRHRHSRLMAQEWVPQRDMKLWNFNACVRGGEIVSFSMGERIRTNIHPDGSPGSLLLFGRTARNEAILEQNRRLLKFLQFDGILETEWSQSSADPGRIYLYDFNPRPSGNIRWVFKSGVSLAEQYYRLALGLPPKPQAMRTGTEYAKIFYRQNDVFEALTNSYFSVADKLAVIKDDLRALALCHRHAVDVLDWSDLGPTLRAGGEFLALISSRLRERSRFARNRRSRPAPHATSADDVLVFRKRPLPPSVPGR